jgi:hypothetical protein
MTWPTYKSYLTQRILELAAVDPNPERTIDDRVDFHLGEVLAVSKPEQLLDDPMFVQALERNQRLRTGDFPMKVRQMEIDVMPDNLRDWLDLVLV